MFLAIAECDMTIMTFDFWMSKTRFYTYVLVINFIDDDWVPCHVTISMFETLNTHGAALTEQVKSLLAMYQLTNKVIAYVKNENTNLNILAFALTNVISCELLQLPSPFNGICFGHVMSKACQHAINDTKLGVGMKEVSMVDIQNALQKTIIWMKKSSKGRQEWELACKEVGLKP